jgi:transposase InsO family protein
MRIGILGSGLIGCQLGTAFARAGHQVTFSYSRQISPFIAWTAHYRRGGCDPGKGAPALRLSAAAHLLAPGRLATNPKRLFRSYREERLMVRNRGGRKRALGRRAPMQVPGLPNGRWSLDFVSDPFVCGRRFRILGVFDDCTRECLAVIADTSLSGLVANPSRSSAPTEQS